MAALDKTMKAMYLLAKELAPFPALNKKCDELERE